MAKQCTHKSEYGADEHIWAKGEEISGTWRTCHIEERDDLPPGDQIKEDGISETRCA